MYIAAALALVSFIIAIVEDRIRGNNICIIWKSVVLV